MAAAVSIRVADGADVIARETNVHVQVTGLASNAADGSEKRYYLIATKSGQDSLRSHVFSPSYDGKHEWDDLMFPATGSWTMTLKDVTGDSTVASHSVTVE